MARFFVPKKSISETITINGDDATHISRVLRLRSGDKITVCDGEGTDYLCEITDISKKDVMCRTLSSEKNTHEPFCAVTVYQGLPKGAKMEYIIQKCVEIGVFKIVPFTSERTVAKGDGKPERWNKVAAEAAKQCGRGIVPSVEPVTTFDAALDAAKQHELLIFAYEEERANTLKSVLRSASPKSVGVFIGPEGGFAPSEFEAAQCSGCYSVTLGQRILRTETAASVVLSDIMYEYEQ